MISQETLTITAFGTMTRVERTYELGFELQKFRLTRSTGSELYSQRTLHKYKLQLGGSRLPEGMGEGCEGGGGE